MEQLIREIEAYCAAQNISPQKLLREVLNAKWGTWAAWKAGQASPTLASVDRLRARMAAEAEPEDRKGAA